MEQEQEIIRASVRRAKALRAKWLALALAERFPVYAQDVHMALPKPYATVSAVLQSVALRMQKTKYFALTEQQVQTMQQKQLPQAPALWVDAEAQTSIAGTVLRTIDDALAQEEIPHDLKIAHLLAAGIALTMCVTKPAELVVRVGEVLGRPLVREDGAAYYVAQRWRVEPAPVEPSEPEPSEPAPALAPEPAPARVQAQALLRLHLHTRHGISGIDTGGVTSFVFVASESAPRAQELLAELEREDRLITEQEQRMTKLFAELRELTVEPA